MAAEVAGPHALLLLLAPAAALATDPRQARLQARLVTAIRDPAYRSPLKAKAVVVIYATDPLRAATDAVAAVEAMV